MSDKRYNGWTNYETWNVKLWMDNDEGSYRYYGEIAKTCWEDADGDESAAVSDLRERLKDEYESSMHDWLDESGKQASVWADLIGAALCEVNWHEIAEYMIADVDKEVAAE